MTFSKNNIALISGFVLVLVLQLSNLNNTFFWDTIQLGSSHASFFYSTGFSNLMLPDSTDSGHIPAFGFYLALLWQLFGRTLVVSHLAMVPFAIIIVWQLYKLCLKFIPREYAGWAMLLILIDPTLLSQLTLASPDVPLVCFFLLAINAVLENRKYLLMISALLLFLTSMRGMMVVVCLLLLDLHCNISLRSRSKLFLELFKRSLLYIPSLLVFVAFSGYHYAQKGWIGYHKNSPWADCFAPVDFKGFVFNVAMYGWRLLDFGRIGIWIVFAILCSQYGKRLFAQRQTRTLLFFVICLMVFLPANMLWAKNLLAHRYLLPIYLMFALLAAALLFQAQVRPNMKKALSFLWLAVLISGNFWIYPDKIAKGWDSTPAHLPYYKLRHEALGYLDREGIDFKQVNSFFPNTSPVDILDLNHDMRNFNTFDGSSPYVFYSNIYNIDDAAYDEITTRYKAIKSFRKNGVYITIYKKP